MPKRRRKARTTKKSRTYRSKSGAVYKLTRVKGPRKSKRKKRATRRRKTTRRRAVRRTTRRRKTTKRRRTRKLFTF